MLKDIDLTKVLEGLKKIKSGKLVSVSGDMMFTKGVNHVTCWDNKTENKTQLFLIENSKIDGVISTLESKTFEQNL